MGTNLNRHSNALMNKEILAIDGEGLGGPNEVQDYVMVCASSGSYRIDENGLSTEDIFNWLWLVGQNKLIVGFGLSYDVNQWLRDLPLEALELAYTGAYVKIGNWELQYRHRKSFYLRQRGWENGITVWDIHPFFQCSFLKALKAYDIEHEEGIIQSGKASRGAFTKQELREKVLPYCYAEVIALKLLADKLRDYLKIANLSIQRFDGAGAVAAALLARQKVKAYMKESPLIVEEAARFAYSGGRIEVLQYGHTERDVHHYDINSAYPYAALFLPSLVDGKWEETEKGSYPLSAEEFSLWEVEWDYEERHIYPFVYRAPDMSILYPQIGANWVWASELYSAISTDNNPAKFLNVKRGYRFIPSRDIRPFAFLNELFMIRAKWKQEGQGAEKALKLGINSVYGKLAQQVGYNAALGKRPPFHQIEWAGFITAYTRATLYRAAMQHPDRIIALSTDGVYSLTPLKLPLGKGLGEWSYELHNSMSIVQSGVYWLDKGEEEQSFYRGFDAGALQRKDVIKAWSQGEDKLAIPCTRFITLGTALAQNPPLKDWRKWITTERELILTMRNFDTKRIDIEGNDLSKGLTHTTALPNVWFPEFSNTYPCKWFSTNPADEKAVIEVEDSNI